MRIYDNTEFFGYLFIKSKFIDRLYITSDFYLIFLSFCFIPLLIPAIIKSPTRVPIT